MRQFRSELALVLLVVIAIKFGRCGRWCSWSKWTCGKYNSYGANCTPYRSRSCNCSPQDYYHTPGCIGNREQFRLAAPPSMIFDCPKRTFCNVYPTGNEAGSPWCEWSRWTSWQTTCSKRSAIRKKWRRCMCQSEILKSNACNYGAKQEVNSTKYSTAGCINTHGSWCSWREWGSCSGGNCLYKKKRRTRTCSCPSPRGTGQQCNHTYATSKGFEERSCCSSGYSWFSNSYMIIGFVVVAVVSGAFIVLRMCCYSQYRRRAAARNAAIANTSVIPNINPATAASSINVANASYPRQQVPVIPPIYEGQGQMNMGYVPSPPPYPIGGAPPPTTDAAPPAYDEIFKNESAVEPSAPPALDAATSHMRQI